MVRQLYELGTRLSDLQSKDVIREDDDLISSVFVIFDEELTCLELLGIHAVQKHALSRLLSQIFAVELGGHWTPNFCTLKIIISSITTEIDDGQVVLPEHSRCDPLQPDPSSWPHTT